MINKPYIHYTYIIHTIYIIRAYESIALKKYINIFVFMFNRRYICLNLTKDPFVDQDIRQFSEVGDSVNKLLEIVVGLFHAVLRLQVPVE